MFCPKCGTENRDSAKFCDECGTRFNKRKHAAKSEVSEVPPALKILVVIVAIITAVIILFLFLSQVFTNHPPSTGSTTTIIFNPANGTSYTGDVEYSSNTILKGDIAASGNVIVRSGVTLTTNGFSIIAGGAFDNSGTINAGNPRNNAALGANGQNYANSYGGSGGSGGGGGGSASSGSTPTAPNITNTQLRTWYGNGMFNYLAGAGGGGGCPLHGFAGNGGSTLVAGGTYKNRSNACTAGGGIGGSGSYGVYIQANSIVAGTINANGQKGNAGPVDVGGGGGGGAILLAYGNGNYVAGAYDANGGPARGDSGAGGDGQILNYSYGSTPPITPP